MTYQASSEKRKRMKRAVVYIRFSSHKQHGNFSVEYQHEECMKYLEKQGYKFVRQYVDEAKTGKKVAGRDAFNEMIRDGEAGKFDVVIVFSFSRSFRNTRDALNYIMDMQEKSSIIFESVIEPIDMTSPHGKFSATNLFSMHELQSDITASHVKSSMYVAAKQGYYLGGFVPYGYALKGTGEFSRGKERKKYIPHPEESAEVVRMFELYADGYSLGYVQEYCKRRGIVGRRGGVMGDQTIARILKSEFYIGTRDYSIKGYDPLKIEHAVPAIITPELWQRVKARHAAQAPKPRKTKRLYSLTGKIYCAKCGAHMFGVYKGDKRADQWSYAYYHCASKKAKRTCDAKNIRKDKLDAYCLAQIRKHILNDEKIAELAAEIVNQAGTTPDDVKKELKAARKRRTELAGYIKDIVKKSIEGNEPPDVLQELKAEYTNELAETDLRLMQLESAEQNAITLEAVEEYLRDLLENIDSKNEEIIKSIFDKLIQKIVISDDKIELFLVVSPYPVYGDKPPQGHPCVALSLNIARKAFTELY